MMKLSELPSDVREPVARLLEGLRRIAEGEDPDTDLRRDLSEALDSAHSRARWGKPHYPPLAAVSNNVAQLRGAKGWTQAELAERMREAGFDWKRGTVSHVELVHPDTGEVQRKVSLEELLALATVFGVGLSRLLVPADGSPLSFGNQNIGTNELRDVITRTEEEGK